MENIYDILALLKCSKQKAVLATIIEVEGSSYRKEGTSMLLLENGEKAGVLSAGCLEEDLFQRAADFFGTSKSATLTFNMKNEDDLLWGTGAGCNGIIHVLVQGIDEKLREHLLMLGEFLKQGKTVTVVKKITHDLRVSHYLFISEDEYVFGEWEGAVSPNVKKLMLYGKEKSGVAFFNEHASYVYVHCFYPKPRLLLFGGGEDAIPLARLAAQTGFSVTVTDWRRSFCHREAFPLADELIVSFPHEVINKMTIQSKDFVVILTHNFQRDQEILSLLEKKQLYYVGVLGSANRTKRLFEGREVPPYIYSPVGLSIGAEGPEEIAVSIVAQLVQQQRLAVRESRTSA
ncbi:XdhC family protein [Priestia endophytica]|jgi:xanthine dehydrogenase molybdenum-binding subunit/xanthine dehydrogenase accessory factor|uniref:XdhC family protein n=1 Tax=Priestia endophytica TaxID=135735 RepID=UPI00124C8198|nr:XdhC/CoxI family protein [Priestia endophytica]KAB2495384.1 XdhC family protein [Priestia endophytica]